MYEDNLNVWCNGQHVGYLWRDGGNDIGFQYSEEWLENPVRFPVSVTLPLRSEPYEPGGEKRVAHHFFANLLPEGGSRQRICREKGISEGNDFELLRAIGGECAGALSIAGDEPVQAAAEYQPLSKSELTELLVKRNPSAVVEESAVPPRFSLTAIIGEGDERLALILLQTSGEVQQARVGAKRARDVRSNLWQ